MIRLKSEMNKQCHDTRNYTNHKESTYMHMLLRHGCYKAQAYIGNKIIHTMITISHIDFMSSQKE